MPLPTLHLERNNSVLRGACEPLLVRRTGSLAADLAVTLQPAPSQEVAFHSVSACNAALPGAAVTVPAGESVVTVYLRAIKVGTLRLGATAQGYTPATRDVEVRPRIQRGTCQLGANVTTSVAASQGCALPHAVLRPQAWVVVQPISTGLTPAAAMVACDLSENGAHVECTRTSGDGVLNVHWQVVEVPGTQVIRGFLAANACSESTTTSVTLPTQVDATRSLLLFSHASTRTTWTPRIHRRVQPCVPGGTSSCFQTFGDCTGLLRVQVVQRPGGAVATHADAEISVGFAAEQIALSSSARGLVLVDHEFSTTEEEDGDMCGHVLSVKMSGGDPANPSVNVVRGNEEGMPCVVPRVNFHVQRMVQGAWGMSSLVLHQEVVLDGNTTSGVVTLNGQANMEVMALVAGQGPGGQGGLEIGTGSTLGAARVTTEVTYAQGVPMVTYTRTAGGAAARTTLQILVLENPAL